MRVKICGLTNFADARLAVEAGADLLGFIFYPRSPRYVEADVAAAIVRQLQAWAGSAQKGHHTIGLPPTIGVFVDEPAHRIAAVLGAAGIDYAQLHGGEPPVVLEQLQGRAFKALRPGSPEEAQADAEWYADLGPTAGPQLLVDAYDPRTYGGTGKRADWNAAAGLACVYPRLLLAGGLTPDNVAAAVTAVRPWGVDVSSGVEARPGRKDHGAVRAFVAAAKEAATIVDDRN